MKKFFLILSAFLVLGTAPVSARVERPRIVVGMVIDQMRWDYFYYYYDQFGEGGLKRLIDEGFSYENLMINYVPTVTAIGHSSIYTGTVPAIHGICGNNFLIDGVPTYCCEDNTVQGVGSSNEAALMSPRNLQSYTMGDQLKLATDFRSKVIGVAMKDRAAILPAGHGADAAYWWDTDAGHFVTSTYYMETLPTWVEKFNRQYQQEPGKDVKSTDEGVTLTFRMAEAALENEHLGEGDVTDMLCVSISSTDVIGHAFGTRGPQNKSVYMRLDRDLAHFFSVLDKRYGKDGYLFFLSADHGGAHNPNFLRSHSLPAAGLELGRHRQDYNEQLCERTGLTGKLIKATNSCRIYLDHELIASQGGDLRKVKEAAIDIFRADDRFQFVVDFEQASSTTIPLLIRERIINGYHPHRSGDIILIPRSQYIETSDSADYVGTTHGEWNPYDSHIPFVLMGWHVEAGQSSQPCRIVDIAPTICEMLHIQMPNGCIGNSLR
mgnify:FL=1